MKIAIHASHLNIKGWDGTKVYLYNVLKQMIKLDDRNEYYLYCDSDPELEELESDNFHPVISKWPKYWTQLKFPAEIRRDKPDVLWMPVQTLPYLHPRKIKTVVTVHDLAYIRYPDAYTSKHYKLLLNTTRFAIKKADSLIAVSNSTKKDILDLYDIDDKKVHVVHHGFDRDTFKPSDESDTTVKNIEKVKDKFEIDQPYFLFVGGIRKGKNLDRLIKAFDLAKNRSIPHQLVIVGDKTWKYEDIFKTADRSKYTNDIIFTGSVKTEELVSLLWGSSCLAFPSLWEGFGIPILEAQACGVPVLTSETSSMPEVAGEGAILVDPYSIEDIANGLQMLSRNSEKRAELIRKGFENARKFSWEKAACETLNILFRVTNQKQDFCLNFLGVEASELLISKLKSLESKSYGDLINLVNSQPITESAKKYTIEIRAIWLDKVGGEIKILGSIYRTGKGKVISLIKYFVKGRNSQIYGGIRSDS